MRSGRRVSFVMAVVAAAVVIGLVVAALTDSLWWSPGQPKDASRVSGFETVAFTVTAAGGSRAPVRCALLARTEPQRQRGLMSRRDLAGYAGMVFLWPAPTTEAFYMKDTLIPLSIAWFDQSSRFVSDADMAPCPQGASCPLFSAAAPYTIAVEVPEGGLARLGISPGSTIGLGGACH